MKLFKVQFVCLGNICRSPLAHAVFQQKVNEAKLDKTIHIESSGTGNWHVGSLPDSRMREVAKKAGYIMDHRARHLSYSDINEYDLVLAMDSQNYKEIIAKCKTEEERQKVKLFREFDPNCLGNDKETPDPYFGGRAGFELVLDIVERTSLSLLNYIIKYVIGEINVRTSGSILGRKSNE